jgi:hypothetical protein
MPEIGSQSQSLFELESLDFKSAQRLAKSKFPKTPFFAHVTAIPANPSTVAPGFYMIWKQRGVLLRIQGRQIRREFRPNIIGHAGVQKRDLML